MNLTENIKTRIKHSLLRRFKVNILDSYVEVAPSPQTALDIFKGEWASRMPGKFSHLNAGTLPLFEDDRIQWLIEQLQGVENFTVLELGPLEAGHTFMLEKAGAKSVSAIEANSRAYLKCLVVKELLKLKKSEFLCGDFVEHLRSNKQKFDLCVASGVLYHMKNPIELLSLLSQITENLFLWTHYYDKAVIEKSPRISAKFSQHFENEFSGFKHPLHRYEYGTVALTLQSFCAGSAAFSHWLERDQILQYLKESGFKRIQIDFDDPDHQNGPSFAVLARK